MTICELVLQVHTGDAGDELVLNPEPQLRGSFIGLVNSFNIEENILKSKYLYTSYYYYHYYEAYV